MLNIRDKIHKGCVVSYKSKDYSIINIWYDCGGNCMVVNMIPHRNGEWCPMFVKVTTIADEQIEDCKIIG